MAATVYNLNNVGGSSTGTLLNHQNTSGGNQRVIINYIKMDNNSSNSYIQIHFGSTSSGPNNNDCACKVEFCTAFGKNVAYATQFYNSESYNDHHWQGHSGATGGEDRNAPTEIMIANNEYFKITWVGSNSVQACNIVVIPE